MPSPKNSPKKTNKAPGRDTYTAQLTSGQLVIGVCILIVFGLACFMLGVLVGKFEPSPRPDAARATPVRSAPPAGETSSKTTKAAPPAKTVQESVEPVDSAKQTAKTQAKVLRDTQKQPPAESAKPPKKTPAPKSASGTAKPTPNPPANKNSAPRPVELLKSPSSRASAKTAKGAEKKQGKELGVLEPEDAPPPPARSAKREKAETSKPRVSGKGLPRASTRPKEPNLPEAPVKPTVAAPAKPSTPAVSHPQGPRYTVQIGAYSNRRNAEAAKAGIESTSSHVVELQDSVSGRFVVVVVGDYPERGTAEQARNDLRDRFGFKDCFVTVRKK